MRSFRLKNQWLHQHSIPEEKVINIQKLILNKKFSKNQPKSLPDELKSKIIDFLYFLLAFTPHQYHWDIRKKDIRILLDEQDQLKNTITEVFHTRIELPNKEPYELALEIYAQAYRHDLEHLARELPMPHSPELEVRNNKCALCNRNLFYLFHFRPNIRDQYYPEEFPPVQRPHNKLGPHLFEENEEQADDTL